MGRAMVLLLGACCAVVVCSLIRGAASSLHNPLHCNSTGCIVSYYQNIWLDRTPCTARTVFFPSHESQLIEAVAHASRHHLKIKVVSATSHSTTKLVCPGGLDGVVISTREYTRNIHVDTSAMTVTADAGVRLRDLLDRIAQDGLALPHTPILEWASVAGMISTGSHGSSLWGRGSATHESVVGIRLVVPSGPEDGYARVVILTENDAELQAAKVSLGVLGAISQVTFALQPMFKRSVSLELRDDHNLEDELESFAKAHEFAELAWYPSLDKALFKLDDRVDVQAEGEGVYKPVSLQANPVSVIEGRRSIEEAVEAQRADAGEICKISENVLNQRFTSGDGLLNDGFSFQGFPVVGYSHRMQTYGGCEAPSCSGVSDIDSPTECSPDSEWSTCIFDPQIAGVFLFDTSITVPMSRIHDVIKDIKKIQQGDPTGLCGSGLYVGFWLRFLRNSDAYLGQREDAVVVEFMYYRSREADTPRFKEDVMEEIEQMLLGKYGGRPHWGKNRDAAFEGMERRVVNLPKFLEVRKKLDPRGLFSSEWSDAILGMQKPGARGVQTVRDHCALEGLCICSQDSHCAPGKGYKCRAGRVFKDARVCRFVDLKDEL